MKPRPEEPRDFSVNDAQVLRYLERRLPDLVAISAAIERRDAGAIRDIAHRIKGNAALYGLPGLGLLGASLMEVAEEGSDWEKITRSATEMYDRVNEERKALTLLS